MYERPRELSEVTLHYILARFFYAHKVYVPTHVESTLKFTRVNKIEASYVRSQMLFSSESHTH